MALVALEAQEGFPCVKKSAVNGPMGTVTVETVLCYVCMFINEWASFVRVALDAGFFNAFLEQILPCESSVGIMAVNAEHPSFLERMVAGHGKLCLGRLMAAETKCA